MKIGGSLKTSLEENNFRRRFDQLDALEARCEKLHYLKATVSVPGVGPEVESNPPPICLIVAVGSSSLSSLLRR